MCICQRKPVAKCTAAAAADAAESLHSSNVAVCNNTFHTALYRVVPCCLVATECGVVHWLAPLHHDLHQTLALTKWGRLAFEKFLLDLGQSDREAGVLQRSQLVSACAVSIMSDCSVSQEGLIINIGSIGALSVFPKTAVYVSSKWGLRGWSLSCYEVHHIDIGTVQSCMLNQCSIMIYPYDGSCNVPECGAV